jgi:hypothetical protein
MLLIMKWIAHRTRNLLLGEIAACLTPPPILQQALPDGIRGITCNGVLSHLLKQIAQWFAVLPNHPNRLR